jgi:2'-5' RNA ligase
MTNHARARIMDNSPVHVLRYPPAMTTKKLPTDDEKTDEEIVTAAANEDNLNGGMIALIPSTADVDRLALPDMEPAGVLHLTMWFLTDDASTLSEETVSALTSIAREVAATAQPVETMAFGVDLWNWAGDSPSIVLAVGDPERQLTEIRAAVGDRADDALLNEWQDVVDAQHHPWVPHVCLAYSDDFGVVEQALTKVGPITFDTLHIAIGGDTYDYPLGERDA